MLVKEVTLQNANAWATLREADDDEDEGGGAKTGDKPGTADDDEDGVDDGNDNLWAEFQSREEEQKKRV